MAPKRRGAGGTPSPAAPATPRPSTPTPSAAPSKQQSGSKSAPIAFTDKSTAPEIVLGIWQRYISQTPQRILLLDAFMGFLAVVAVVQFVYCILAGNYPFNAFLSGFGATVGQFVLTASLRMQTSSEHALQSESKKGTAGGNASSGVSSERAFADYIFGSMILHFFCINFIN